MKNTAILWVAVTTFVLFSVTIMAVMNFPFNWVFYITLLGQFFLAVMVYQILTDDYDTSKKFEDFYEDNPIKNRIK